MSNMAALAAGFPNLTVMRDSRWVDEGAIVTSRDVSAGDAG